MTGLPYDAGGREPVVGNMPALDVRKLGEKPLARLVAVFDHLACDKLLPLPAT